MVSQFPLTNFPQLLIAKVPAPNPVRSVPQSTWNKFWDVETDETKRLKQKYTEINEKNYKIQRQEENRRDQFPLLVELKRLKFKEGEKPSDWECQQLYETQRLLGGYGGYGRNRYGY